MITTDMKKENNTLPILTRETGPSLNRAVVLNIKDQEDVKPATELLTQLKLIQDKITKEKERVTRPLNEALKVERGRWKALETELEKAISIVRGKMSAWQTAYMALEHAKRASVASKVAEGSLTLEDGIKQTEAIIKRPTKIEVAGGGSISFKKTKCFEVMDATMLPPEYVLPNDAAIRQAMLIGVELPGVRYWTEERVVSRA